MVEPAVSVRENLYVETAAHDAGPPALRVAFFGFFVDTFDVYLAIVGAMLFGHYAANPGRRRVTIISVGGFAVATLPVERRRSIRSSHFA